MASTRKLSVVESLRNEMQGAEQAVDEALDRLNDLRAAYASAAYDAYVKRLADAYNVND